jgi:cytochrome c
MMATPDKKAGLIPALFTTALLLGGAATSAQAASGEELFKQNCAACHALQKDAPMGMGPNLAAIIGRPAGAVQGFPHSEEFRNALKGKSWTPELLDKWLENPQKVAKGTYMMYQQSDPAIRSAIIDYLKTIK